MMVPPSSSSDENEPRHGGGVHALGSVGRSVGSDLSEVVPSVVVSV